MPNKIITTVIIAILLTIATWLRLTFIHTVQLYPDEFATLLAVTMIAKKGLPIMPSGLFYEHGLLFSYLGYLSSLAGEARWVVRYASLACGLATLGLTTYLGRRYISPTTGLVALAGLTISPSMIHWSGRARMYALLQLLVLLTIWCAYEGLVNKEGASNKSGWRWLALLVGFGAMLTHFVTITLVPPIIIATLLIWLVQLVKAPTAHADTGGLPVRRVFHTLQIASDTIRQRFTAVPIYKNPWLWQLVSLSLIVLTAILIKRVGQPKGIAPIEDTNPALGVMQVLNIYSDLSLNPFAGWQAISPFYLTMPALIFALFSLYYMLMMLLSHPPAQIDRVSTESRRRQNSFGLFCLLILLLATIEMVFLVSADRRDDKYLFMLLPILFLVGSAGLVDFGSWLVQQLTSRVKLPTSLINLSELLYAIVLIGLITGLSWPATDKLLNNSGDDYDNAFAYVKANWQEGDTVLTGTPSAAHLYLGFNDFYSVQRRGGYDYRILTVTHQAVDRWLASPAIRTESALHETLSGQQVWLVLERWGLQQEYYDLPFQQQLLAQTDYQAEAQGVFILRSKPNPQPIALTPAQTVDATFGDMVRLTGYTLEPVTDTGRTALLTANQTLRLTLHWQATAPMPHDYTVFVHLRPTGESGNLTQADHRPLGTIYPTSLWPVGETIRETSELILPDQIPTGEYSLWVGLYQLETGERLPLHGDTSGENAVRLRIEEGIGGLR
ncbi:glycosyltransferase family 39 protein [Anaerolineales bacterium HSG6]|nr:glycosyltransferase family 39 protein [Anaerolineales bacterium HSG6]